MRGGPPRGSAAARRPVRARPSGRRAVARLVALYLALVLAPGAARADLPAGDGYLSYQLRTSSTDDPTITPRSRTEQDLGLFLKQQLPNYGTLLFEGHRADSVEPTAHGWVQLGVARIPTGAGKLGVFLGDGVFEAGLLPRVLPILIQPALTFEGARLDVLAGTGTSLTLFGGEAIGRAGGFATAVRRTGQDVYGARLARSFGPGRLLSALYLHTDGADGIAGTRLPASTDSVGLGADLRIVGPLSFLAEGRYTTEPNAAGAAGDSSGLSYILGPVLERPGLKVEAAAFSLDPSYIPVDEVITTNDLRGAYGNFTWQATDEASVFGTIIRSRNNLAGDPGVTTIETTQYILGHTLLFPLAWPTAVVARGDYTISEGPASTSGGAVDSTSRGLFAEVSQSIGAFRPLARARYSRRDDHAVNLSSDETDLGAELLWQATRRTRYWGAVQWVERFDTAGTTGASRYVGRLGGESRFRPGLFGRLELQASAAQEANVRTTTTGASGSVGYQHPYFSVFLDLRRNWTTSSATGIEDRTDDYAFLRVTVPFRWGTPLPPPAAARPGQTVTAWGTIAGEVFVDVNGNGIREATEVGMPGLRVVLDGNKALTAMTDDDGRFTLDRVAAGPHTVQMEVKKLPAEYDLVSPQLVEVEVTPRGTVRVIYRAEPLGRIAGRIRQVAVDPAGRERPIEERPAISMLLRRGDEVWQTYAGQDGSYAFDNVRGGVYEVVVDPAQMPERTTAEPAGRTVTIGVGATVEAIDFALRETPRPEIRNGPAAAPPSAERSRDCFGDSPEPGMIGFFRFATDSADLPGLEAAAPELSRWARWLGDDPARRIQIEGHTDRRADDPYNFGLSARRAYTVYRALAGAGAPERQMQLVPEGPDLPCDSADTEDAYAVNRRALIIVGAER